MEDNDEYYDEDIGEESNIDVDELDGNNRQMRENFSLLKSDIKPANTNKQSPEEK